MSARGGRKSFGDVGGKKGKKGQSRKRRRRSGNEGAGAGAGAGAGDAEPSVSEERVRKYMRGEANAHRVRCVLCVV